MKNLTKFSGLTVLVTVMVLIFSAMSLTGCNNGGGGGSAPQNTKNLKYSIQVNNKAAPQAKNNAARAINDTDTVELFILNFEYLEDAENRGLIMVANGDRDMGSKGKDKMLNNAKWYSVTADLDVKNDINNGSYSGFQMRISKLKVNGTEYDFPNSGISNGGKLEVVFGSPSAIWGESNYPDNFKKGININDSTVSLKTVLTVDPDIINAENLQADGKTMKDPYKYITVEGIVK